MQAYNAQTAVDADGSYLVVGCRVSQCASDRNESAADVEAIPKSLSRPERVLADNGFLNEKQVQALEDMEVLISVQAEAKQNRRRHDHRPLPAKDKKTPAIRSGVEPVFGTIKKWMGFDQFLLREIEKVTGEWQLVTLAYNLKRLWRMTCAPKQSI